ncbi:hypothetical protein BSK62_11675, partial [Paenibacillus odorifer]
MMEQHYPDTSLNNLTLYFVFRGEVNLEWIESAIQSNLSKHVGLGLRFLRTQDGEPYQYLVPYRKTPLPLIDFSTSNNPKEAFKHWAQQQAAIPYQLENSSLNYFALFKISDDECGYFLKVHHIIADGWSGYVWHRDVLEIYEKLAKGEEHLVGGSSNFLDFADSEKKYLESNRYIKDKRFWLSHYQDFESPTIMGTSKVVAGDTVGTRKSFPLSKELSDRIRERLNENGISLNAWFVSLMLVYLHRTTGQNDLVIGTPVSNRSGSKEKSAIGMFASTMPLRIQINTMQSFDSFAREVQRELVSCYFHQKYPYENLVQELDLRKRGVDQLFSVVVNNYGTRLVTDLESLTVEATEVYSGHQYFPFQFIIRDWSLNGEFELDFDYKANHTDEIVEHIYHSFSVMLQDIVQEPSLKIQDICLLDEKSIEQLTVDFNDTAADYPREATIHGLFEVQVEKTPNAVAVVYEDQKLTYAELNGQANQLAWKLREQGVGSETIVAIMAERSLELIVGILGILKAGGAYLPIDPALPIERIRYMIGDSGAKLLVTTTCSKGQVPINIGTVDLGDLGTDPRNFANQTDVQRSDNLAYVIYTSGSTGRPKGVMVEHRSVVRLVRNTNYIDFSEEHRILQTGSIVFDASTFEIWGALLNGHSIHMAAWDTILDPSALIECVKRDRITTMFLTTALFNQLDQYETGAFASLRYLLTGGETHSPTHIRSMCHKYPNIKIVNVYGPTENTTFSMYYPIVQVKQNNIPIGKPISNTTAYILNHQGNLQPIGVKGELCLGGDGLARGYLNLSELTEEKFVENPYVPGERIYRTGDLARWLPDGNIEFLGRIDHQVKIRGYRIECGEIEAILTAHESVREAVVIPREDSHRQTYLCAYIVSSEALSVPELRAHLAVQLPDYMIPPYFVVLEKLPLTVNGKLDRKALPMPDRDTGLQGYEAPRTTEEALMASVWQDVLNVKRIGVQDSFFELGGDSIKAVQIAARLRQHQLQLAIRDLFRYPTIMKLSPHVQTLARQIDQHPVEGEVPLTPIQHWLFEQSSPLPHHYNQAVMLHRRDGFDESVLQRVFERIVAHHDALRMSYRIEEQGLVQWNGGLVKSNFGMDVIDLRGESAVEERIAAEAYRLQRGLHLQQGPLLRLGLMKTGEGDHLL